MKQEILQKLKVAEEETARRVEAARTKAVDLERDGRRQAEAVLAAATQEAQRDQDDQVNAERARLEQERARLLDEGRVREEQARARYGRAVDAQVARAVDVFARSLDA